MSPERDGYRSHFEQVVAKAKEIALQYEQHLPLLIVEGSSRTAMAQLREMPDTHDKKMELMRLVGEAAVKSGQVGRLEQVYFVSEGWMSVASKDKPPQLRPSQDPDRKEVLIISGLELQGPRKFLQIFEMVRNQRKEVVDLQEMLPPGGREGEIEIPLLDAFVQGFRVAFQTQVN